MQTKLLNSRPAAKFASFTSIMLAIAFVLTPALAFAAPERSTSVVDTKSVKNAKGSSLAKSGHAKAKHAPAKKSDKRVASKPCGHAPAHAHARTAAAPRKTAHR